MSARTPSSNHTHLSGAAHLRAALIVAAMVLCTHGAAAQRTAVLRADAHGASAGAALHRLDHALSPAGEGAPAAMPAADPARVTALPETVRVLAVMVEFQTDSDARTSGTGKFGSIYPQDYGAEIIDPLPHDRAYFEAHLRFLQNYVAKASGGRTIVETRVLDAPVTVSKTIREYSYRKNETEKPVAALAAEAWSIADTTFPSVDFSAYQMFIVFHAGRGRDIDLASIQGSDPTPYDIPSLSFTLASFRRLLGASYAGIPVRGGAFHITNTSVIPTTDVREIPMLTGGFALLELTINGLLASSFGTYAGLPDLFNTKTGVTGIGRFGLMDPEGIFAYGGICPPAPSAWEKQFLGWTSPREAAPGRRQYFLTAQRYDQPSTADVIRVPITAREYWLLENRQRDPGGDGQRVTMRTSGGQDLDLRFPKDTTGFENGSIALLKGVVTDVEDLDWSLPGGTVVSDKSEQRINGGVLIWHVDENIIRDGLASNSVNNNASLRGLDLEQAGGPQDIGRDVPSLFGTSTGTGSPVDFWFKDNISPLYTNSFGMLTTPDTRANSGAYTHVTIDKFGVPGPLMTLDIALGDNTLAPLAGWPVDLAPVLGSDSARVFVTTADLDADLAHDIIASSAPGRDTAFVCAYKLDGTPFLSASATGCAARIPGIASVTGAPLVGDIDGDGIPEIVLVGTRGPVTSVCVMKARNTNNDGLFDMVRRLDYANADFGAAAGPHSSAFMIRNGALTYRTIGAVSDTLTFIRGSVSTVAIGAGSGRAQSIAGYAAARAVFSDGIGMPEYRTLADGSRTPARSAVALTASSGASHIANIAVADFDGDGAYETAAQVQAGIALCLPDDGIAKPFIDGIRPATVSLRAGTVALAAADVDGDNRTDLVLADSTRVLALNAALASVNDYPARVSAQGVLAARLSGDTRDALFVAGNGMLSQLRTGARQADGFPVPLPENASVVLLPLGSSGAATLGVAAAGDGGRVFLFDTKSALAAGGLVWRAPLANETQDCVAHLPAGAAATSSVFFPTDRCYNWPNPVYEKITKIRFYVSKDAEVAVKITDIAGAVVDELRMHAAGGLDNELDWNVQGIQSGVYLARVQATAGSESGERIIKIAVVK